MSQELNLSILSQQTASYTTTLAWANVPQFIITVPTGEDGDYTLKGFCVVYGDTAGDSTYVRLAVNGNPATSDVADLYVSAGVGIAPVTLIAFNVALKASDVVSLQALYAGSATVVLYGAGVQQGSLQIIKRGV